MPKFNKYQERIKETYAGGDFSDCANLSDVEVKGDTFFEFLMNEFANDGGTMSQKEATNRFSNILKEISMVGEAVLKA